MAIGNKLPDGSAFFVMPIPKKKFIDKWRHKLFECPTFWSLLPKFMCPRCNKLYRCYWDGNDVSGHGIDYCDKCAEILEKE